MNSALDRLLRVIDLVDIRFFRRLVLVGSDEDLKMLRGFLGDGDTAYLLIGRVQNLGVSNFWFELPKESFDEAIASLKPYIVSEVSDVLAYIDLSPSNLVITYEVFRELKMVSRESKKLLFLKISSSVSDYDAVNILTYLTLLIKEGLVSYILLISNELLKYLELINGGKSLTKCLETVLKNSDNVEHYLRGFHNLGVITCLPKVNLDVFGNLLNVVRFSLHIIGDYSSKLETALLIVLHDFKNLDLEIGDVSKYFGLSDLHVVGVRDAGNTLTVVLIKPKDPLLGSLKTEVIRVYEFIKNKDLSIFLEDLVRVVDR